MFHQPLLSVIAIFGITFCAAILTPYSSTLSAAEPSEISLTTERVIVFKDGYCLVVKKGTATTDENGFAFTKEVPDSAILGSFWATAEEGTIKSMIAGWDELKTETSAEINCTNIIEIVKANIGKTCSFDMGDKKYEGILLKLLSNDGLKPSTTQSTTPINFTRLNSAARMSAIANSLRSTVITAQYFILKTDEGEMMIAANMIRNLTIDGMVSTMDRTTTKREVEKKLSLKFDNPNSKVAINLMYFRPDVRWIPTYRINLTDKEYPFKGKDNSKRKTAEINMQGEILNEAEDFTDVPFHVVVGVPNFRFKTIPSPMVLESDLRNALVEAAPQIMGNGSGFNNMSNALYTQRSGEFASQRGMGRGQRAEVEMPKELSGSGGNDLFVYKLDKMTLKKGERATVPILSSKVAYRDVYTWDVNITHAETYAATASDATSPLVLTENEIWRQVELINDTDLPWTTGAAMFVDDYQPLAQELLTYTSPGGICRVPVTVSVDLQGKVSDSETKREYDAMKWRRNNYAKIHGKIEVELANNKEESVPVEVRVRFGGKADNISNNGDLTLSAFRQEDWHNRNGDPINNSSLVKWKATVEPGECFKPTIDYNFFLRY